MTLLRSGGSTVELGNLLSLPVGGGLLYVEPVYLRANGPQGYPQLKKVLAAYGNTVAFENTLPAALEVLFKGSKPSTGGGGGDGSSGGGGGSSTPAAELAKALADTQTAYADGQKALAAGDFAAYGVAQKKLKEALDRAAKAGASLTGASPSASPTPSPIPSGTPTVTSPASAAG